jgi:hypothetical protein
MPSRSPAPLGFAALCLLVACGSSSGANGFGGGGDASTGDGGVSLGDASLGDASGLLEGGTAKSCNPMSLDQAGCECDPATDKPRACYTGDPKTRSIGVCKDGTQSCVKQPEGGRWGACMGDVTPTQESCSPLNQFDTNCNGKIGCSDPTCTTFSGCNTGCTDGQTRPCYTGPSGTENVGACKDGKQTCANGQWPTTCDGQVLPTTENCCDNSDQNCNGLAGCWDLFVCATAQCCQEQCQSPLDPGCVCPKGSGDQMTCPVNFHDVHKGGFPGTDECCPCAASDCGDVNCCGSTACGAASGCGTCKPLPASCNGQVSADCDDFPEDCDEPCCLCSQCP